MNPSKHFSSIFLLILFLGFNTIYSQDIECAFQLTSENKRYYDSIKKDINIFEQKFLNSKGTLQQSSVPLKAHIVRTSEGSGGLDESDLDDALEILNEIYLNAGLEFFLCDGINYIDNDNFYDYETDDESDLFNENSVSNILNIYFTDQVVNSSSGNGLCGYARYPGGPITENILMKNSCATNGSTLAHEVGHFYGLLHTHGGSNTAGSTEELVNGTNCESTGDFICDTSADPQLGSANVDSDCNYIGRSRDANTELYAPDPLNLMSYSLKACRTTFSEQQFARINAVYNISRLDLGCQSFSADFVADNTESCQSDFTVNFTDTSAGATNWSWDLNADGIVDYTTQNITHTFTDFGSYDIALEVTNGIDTLTKIKSEYIVVGAQNINTPTISLNLTLDSYPNETTWEFLDGDGTALYSGGPYISGTDNFTTITEEFNILQNSCYSFVIKDSFGDGICCGFGEGNYELRDSENLIIASSIGNFGSISTNNFGNNVLGTNDFSVDSVSIYPNPSSSRITVKSRSLPSSYIIYNTLGQVLKQSKINSVLDLDIDVENLSSNLYFIKLRTNNYTQVLSFIKN